jgi:plastocyanin
MRANRGISSIAAVVVVLVILILTSGAVAISFDAIGVGQNTSTLTLTVVNTNAGTDSPSSNLSANSSSSANYSVHVTGILVAYTAPFIASYNLTHGGINTTVDEYNIVVLRNETGGTSGHGEYIGFVTTSTDSDSNVRRSTMVLTYVGTVGNSQPGIFSAIATMTYTYFSANRSITVNGKVTVVQGSGQGGLTGICGEETVQGVLGPPFTFTDTYYFGASCSSDSSIGSNVTISNPVQNQTSISSSSSVVPATTVSSSPQQAQISIIQGAGSNSSITGFTPATITVVMGVNNTVVWTNDDSVPHTVTAYDGSFNSGAINPGGSYNFTFTSPGTYEYHCSYHPWMKGTVVVKSA